MPISLIVFPIFCAGIQDTYETTKKVEELAPKQGYVFSVKELKPDPYMAYSHSYLGNGLDAYRMQAVQAMPSSKGINPCFANGNGTISLTYSYNGVSGGDCYSTSAEAHQQ